MRREATITIEAEGRDKGKVFILREMASEPATDWFCRALQLLARSGVEVPPDILSRGPLGFAAMGMGAVLTGLGKAPFPELKGLMDELMRCVSHRSPNGQVVHTDPYIVSEQIEDVETRFRLMEEVLSLHLGFSMAAYLSDLKQTAAAMINTISEIGGTMSTSTPPSEPSSPLN